MKKLTNFIDGEFVAPQSKKYLDNFDPSTGKVYSQTPDSDELDTIQAISAAKRAFKSWSETSVEERAKIACEIAKGIEENFKELALAESRDVGKPLELVEAVDVPRAIKNFRYFADFVSQYKEPELKTDEEGVSFYTLRQAVGVAGLIIPWNLPLYLLTWKVAPAIMTGNTCVLKPSELTPMTASLMGEIFNNAGLPKGVVNIVHGRGAVVGATLAAHPSVSLISFTGSTDTGREIQKMGANHCKKLSLELGGKNAHIVLKDADFEKALEASLLSAFLNSGQICLSGSRLFVQKDIYDKFMGEFRKRAQQLVVGDPLKAETFMGPVVSAEHFKKVKSCIEQARTEQGEVTVGSEDLKLNSNNSEGYFLRPTVIEELTDCSPLWQEEIFGPVVFVRPFKYPHEAVKWANTSSYGLSASVWTANLERAKKIAADLEVGTVWINDWMRRSPAVPFGGMKESGLGREGGFYSLDFYTEIKTVGLGE